MTPAPSPKPGDKKKNCIWTEDMTDGYWETSCHGEFVFETEGPKANGMKFCCYCGKRLKEGKP